jgi:Flp pilus assembly pilin Flp
MSACCAGRIGERGASLVEYVLLLSLVALACFAALKFFGTQTAVPYSGAAMGSRVRLRLRSKAPERVGWAPHLSDAPTVDEVAHC